MNEQEFNQKVMVYTNKFYGYSYKLLGNYEESRDAVQDLYVKLWSMKDNLSSINNIEAFATTIIRNLCIDKLNRNKRSLAYKESQKEFVEQSHFDLTYEKQDVRLELVRDAIKQLPDVQQKVFIMRDFEEKEFDNIASEMDLNPENVRVILSRARKRIREIVDDRLLHL